MLIKYKYVNNLMQFKFLMTSHLQFAFLNVIGLKRGLTFFSLNSGHNFILAI